MHIVAHTCNVLDEKNLDKNFVKKEKSIIEEQIDKNGKKSEIIENY